MSDKKKSMILKAARIVLKVFLVIIVLLAIMIGVLAKVGGNSPALKGAIEDYFHDATGYNAEIGRLNNLSFFPNVNIDFERLALREPGDENPAVLIKKLNLKLGFWDAIGGSGRIKNIGIDDLRMKKGLITRDPLRILKAGIQDNGETASLVIDGTFGEEPIKASATLAAYGEEGSRSYDLGKDRKFNVTAGDVTFSAHMKNSSFTHIDLEDLKVMKAGQSILSGDLDVKTKGGAVTFAGDIVLGKGSSLQPNVKIGEKKIKGKIIATTLHGQDVAALAAIADQMKSIFPQDEKKSTAIDLQSKDVDLTLDVQKLMLGGHDLGKQTLEATVKDGRLDVTASDGVLAGGATDFSLNVMPTGDAYKLSVNTRIDKLSMAQLLQASGNKIRMNTNMDSVIKLGSTAQSWDGLSKNMQGTITTTLDKGRFESSLLNLWGNGLGSLILPNFNPQEETKLNCAIANATVKNGLADFSTIFLDTPNVGINGGGFYSFSDDRLNIKLKPATKDISIGDISAGVKITGSLASPSISADIVDVTKKVAGALLSAVNPAFLVMAGVDANILQDDDREIENLCNALSQAQGNKAQAMASHLKGQ